MRFVRVRFIVCAAALVIISGVTGPSLLSAAEPDWTSVESEIWELERTYHRQIQVEDFAGVAEFWHEEGVAWPSYAAEPLDLSAGREALSALLESVQILSFEVHPMAIHIIGDLALVHYLLTWEIKDADESKSTSSSRITHTWFREGGSWRIIGGMSSSVDDGSYGNVTD